MNNGWAVLSGRLRSGGLVDCAMLTMLAAVLRLAWLGHASLWIDELFSVCWSQLDLRFLLGEGARTETNPPGYYVLLHGWMEIFGTTEVAVRALSALASTITVVVVYGIGRMMVDRPTAMLGGLLMAVNPVAIATAQEARGYALSALLDGVGLLSIVGYRRHLEAGGRRSWPWLGAFVLSMVATASVHYTSLLFVAACFGGIGWRLLTVRPFPAREALVWTATGILTSAALVKLVMLAASLSGSNNLVWIGPLTAWSVVYFFLALIVPLPGGEAFSIVVWASSALLLLIVLGAAPRSRGDQGRAGVLGVIPGLYCGLFIFGSWLRPMLLARVATWLVIPLCLILARAAVGQPGRWRRWAACAAPVLIFLFCVGCFYRFDQKEDWRGALLLVATDPRCQGPVLVSEFNALGLYYYGVRVHRPAFVFLPDPRRRNSVEFSLSQRLMHLPELETGAVVAFIAAHRGSVVIMRGEYASVIPRDLQELLARAPLNARLDGDLTVACF